MTCQEKLPILVTKLAYIWQNIGFFFLLWIGITALAGGGIYFLLTKCQRKRLKIIGFNLLFLVILLNTIFFLGEAYFRFVFDYSDTLGDLKTCKRWLERHVISNADHFRDRNFSTTKAPGVTRIAILGDSFAFGWGMETKERFSNILEKKLNDSARGNPSEGVTPLWEVYNTSIPGWESKDQLEFLKNRAGLFHFDIIVLSYFLNDIYKDRALNIDFMNPSFEKFRKHPLLKPILGKSYFLEFFLVHFLSFSNTVSYDINEREMILYKDEKSWQNHQETLEGIINHCQENKQRLVVVIFPYLDLVNQKPYPAEFIHQKLKELFEEKNIEVIDLYPELQDHPLEKLQANPFDMHPSSFVHKIAADQLYQILTNSKK